MEMEKKVNNKNQTEIAHIPHIVEEIFEHLEIRDLQICAAVCRLWKKISFDIRRRRNLEEEIGLSELRYHEDLEQLEALMTSVERSGSFFVQDFLEITTQKMPKIEVDGVGALVFPVSSEQSKQLIEQSVRAPYGRGEETVLDVSVRKVWQLPPEKVHIVGTSWSGYLGTILSKVQAGLGCQDASVTAELYKLLVYDEGSFFKPHRDTEKTANMFGTLVVVLPSVHHGGELIIFHGQKQVKCDLSTSEKLGVAFTAFYADCKHEVLPILEGNRVCLVYNLLQQPCGEKISGKGLVAPNYDREIEKAAEILKSTLMYPEIPSAPKKIVWILEHQYSQASLSFASLKNADSALARVFSEAATIANCDIYVAIVNLKEAGSVRHIETEDYRTDYFTEFRVDEGKQYLTNFVDTANDSVDFGKLDIEERELLPNGALYGEPPDKERLTEVAGNEGATFERSYHRAALVIWKHNLHPVGPKKRKISKNEH